MKRWTDKEYAYLKENYNVLPMHTIESQLERSESSIRAKIHYLRKRGWTFNRRKDCQE